MPCKIALMAACKESFLMLKNGANPSVLDGLSFSTRIVLIGWNNKRTTVCMPW